MKQFKSVAALVAPWLGSQEYFALAVTNKSLRQLLCATVPLRRFCLPNKEKRAPAGFWKSPFLRGLDVLDLSFSVWLTDADLASLLSELTSKPTVVIIDGCSSLTSASISTILVLCPHLKAISFTFEQISPNQLEALLDKSRQIAHIRCPDYGHAAFTPTGLQSISVTHHLSEKEARDTSLPCSLAHLSLPVVVTAFLGSDGGYLMLNPQQRNSLSLVEYIFRNRRENSVAHLLEASGLSKNDEARRLICRKALEFGLLSDFKCVCEHFYALAGDVQSDKEVLRVWKKFVFETPWSVEKMSDILELADKPYFPAEFWGVVSFKDRNTIMHHAITINPNLTATPQYAELLKMLIRIAPMSPFALNERRKSSLQLAASYWNMAALKVFVDLGYPIESSPSIELIFAMFSNGIDVLKAFKEETIMDLLSVDGRSVNFENPKLLSQYDRAGFACHRVSLIYAFVLHNDTRIFALFDKHRSRVSQVFCGSIFHNAAMKPVNFLPVDFALLTGNSYMALCLYKSGLKFKLNNKNLLIRTRMEIINKSEKPVHGPFFEYFEPYIIDGMDRSPDFPQVFEESTSLSQVLYENGLISPEKFLQMIQKFPGCLSSRNSVESNLMHVAAHRNDVSVIRAIEAATGSKYIERKNLRNEYPLHLYAKHVNLSPEIFYMLGPGSIMWKPCKNGMAPVLMVAMNDWMYGKGKKRLLSRILVSYSIRQSFMDWSCLFMHVQEATWNQVDDLAGFFAFLCRVFKSDLNSGAKSILDVAMAHYSSDSQVIKALRSLGALTGQEIQAKIDEKRKIEMKSKYADTDLFMAVALWDFEGIAAIVEMAGASIEQRDVKGRLPIHVLLQKQILSNFPRTFFGAINLLTRNGTPELLNAIDDDCMTPLAYALESDAEELKTRSESDTEKSQVSDYLLNIGAKLGKGGLVKYLRSSRADFSNGIMAEAKLVLSVVSKWILVGKADVNEEFEGETPLDVVDQKMKMAEGLGIYCYKFVCDGLVRIGARPRDSSRQGKYVAENEGSRGHEFKIEKESNDLGSRDQPTRDSPKITEPSRQSPGMPIISMVSVQRTQGNLPETQHLHQTEAPQTPLTCQGPPPTQTNQTPTSPNFPSAEMVLQNLMRLNNSQLHISSLISPNDVHMSTRHTSLLPSNQSPTTEMNFGNDQIRSTSAARYSKIQPGNKTSSGVVFVVENGSEQQLEPQEDSRVRSSSNVSSKENEKETRPEKVGIESRLGPKKTSLKRKGNEAEREDDRVIYSSGEESGTLHHQEQVQQGSMAKRRK